MPATTTAIAPGTLDPNADLTIKVTALDIAKGVQFEGDSCALARVLHRHFADSGVTVNEYGVHVVANDQDYYYWNEDIADWITAFDKDRASVQPRAFVLTPQSERAYENREDHGYPEDYEGDGEDD